jgi:REP element-mobilizing transposase RayT
LDSVGDEQAVLTDVGRMVSDTWTGLGDRFPLDIDAFVVMPNHLHGVVVLHGEEPARQEPAPTLSDIIRRFKSFTANRVRHIIVLPPGGMWQRNYFEHVIRSEEELNKIRAYIVTNPLRWHLDRENPEH